MSLYIEKAGPILYICPICRACRSTQDINPKPCRLCGHELIAFFEWWGREMMQSAAELAPAP
jgi:hypothetical protein